MDRRAFYWHDEIENWAARYKEINERVSHSLGDVHEQLCATVRVAIEETRGDRSIERLRRVLRFHGYSITRKGIQTALRSIPKTGS